MTSIIKRVQKLNDELYDNYHNNTLTTQQEVFGKLGELKQAIKEVLQYLEIDFGSKTKVTKIDVSRGYND